MDTPFEVPVISANESDELFTDYFETNHFSDDSSDKTISISKKELSNQLQKTLIVLETKVRHVRTREGSQRFDLPIGAPILNKPDINVLTDSSIETPGSHILSKGELSYINPNDVGYDVVQASLDNVINSGFMGAKQTIPVKIKAKRKKVPDVIHVPKFKVTKTKKTTKENITITYKGADRKTGRQLTLTYVMPKGNPFDSDNTVTLTTKNDGIEKLNSKNISPIDVFGHNEATADNRLFLIVERELKRPHIEALYEEFDKEQYKPTHDNFAKAYSGIYGVDWLHGDEPEDFETADITNIKRRKELIVEEQKSLVIYSDSDDDNQHVNYQAQELINSNARVMEDLFPGFSLYQSTYILDTDTSANAYNIPLTVRTRNSGNYEWLRQMSVFEGFGADDWDNCGIGLNPGLYGDKPVSMFVVSRYLSDQYSLPMSHFDPKIQDMNMAQKMALSTLVHETGHTLGRAWIGELQMDNKNLPGSTRNKYFEQQMGEILSKYAIISDGTVADEYISLDKSWVSKLLGDYGSSNIHEFMAECWREYMLSISPRPLATEVGNIMSAMFNEYLKAEGV